jgi:hypothetical protein
MSFFEEALPEQAAEQTIAAKPNMVQYLGIIFV